MCWGSSSPKKPHNDANCISGGDWELVILKRHPQSPGLWTCQSLPHGLPAGTACWMDTMVLQTWCDKATKRHLLACHSTGLQGCGAMSCRPPERIQMEAGSGNNLSSWGDTSGPWQPCWKGPIRGGDLPLTVHGHLLIGIWFRTNLFPPSEAGHPPFLSGTSLQ